jgi:hypothetical protein
MHHYHTSKPFYKKTNCPMKSKVRRFDGTVSAFTLGHLSVVSSFVRLTPLGESANKVELFACPGSHMICLGGYFGVWTPFLLYRSRSIRLCRARRMSQQIYCTYPHVVLRIGRPGLISWLYFSCLPAQLETAEPPFRVQRTKRVITSNIAQEFFHYFSEDPHTNID